MAFSRTSQPGRVATIRLSSAGLCHAHRQVLIKATVGVGSIEVPNTAAATFLALSCLYFPPPQDRGILVSPFVSHSRKRAADHPETAVGRILPHLSEPKLCTGCGVLLLKKPSSGLRWLPGRFAHHPLLCRRVLDGGVGTRSSLNERYL